MKKKLIIAVLSLTVLFTACQKAETKEAETTPTETVEVTETQGTEEEAETVEQQEPALPEIEKVRGVWFSYYDWIEMQTDDEETFRKNAVAVMDKLTENHLNTIIVHVHSHSDSYYPSKYFPMSMYCTGKMGKELSYDPLSIMIEEAHAKGIRIHAWMNPYRVTSSGGESVDGSLKFDGVKWEYIPEDSIVKQWKNSESTSRNVLYHDGQYYLNPSKEEVQNYLASTVKELVENYDVDGVHFDDYFYPMVNDSDASKSFDLQEYYESGSTLSVANWRRENVSKTVALIYKTIKDVDPTVEFGVSPMGNLEVLKSDNQYFTDIDTWLSDEGYLDYVMPQIYWGFHQKNKDGSPSPAAYENCLNSWQNLSKHEGLSLYVGLGLYRCGTDAKDNNAVSEWLSNSDIISRQVKLIDEKEDVAGFCLFDYRDLSREAAQPEVLNLKEYLSANE